MSVLSRLSKYRRPLVEAASYAVVVVLGLGCDIAIGYAAHRFLNLPLIVGAAFGFLTGVAVNYVLFELWVFRGGHLSWLRLGKVYVAALGALSVRLIAVWALGRALGGAPQAALLTLIGAAGFSFLVNFVLVRLFLGTSEAVKGLGNGRS